MTLAPIEDNISQKLLLEMSANNELYYRLIFIYLFVCLFIYLFIYYRLIPDDDEVDDDVCEVEMAEPVRRRADREVTPVNPFSPVGRRKLDPRLNVFAFKSST